ncbi:alpha/beta fold hydrolase [Rhodohalobacter mucosus]|uniref:Alpha/beta hydrolase n=1 Tax=Rhodohalobacter mucosus TaxID=2079485 RepID=A0A316TQ26_9BACT|nr:alpha/beta fold hydrolase [Rhodohalobacter mucosus]PWN06707.1 alpha/beta hydrolase [Rhodohalobacter mucosus]
MKQSLWASILTLFILLSACSGDPNHYESFHSFDDTRIAYTDEGSGEFVLLIHGFIVDGSINFGSSELKRELLENGYRVIVPDLRGNGRSDKPQDEEAYMNDAEIKDLMALMDHLGAESYMTVGYSRGAILLANLLTKDDRITKAVFGGMGLEFTDPDWYRRREFGDVFAGRAEPKTLTQGAVDYARAHNVDFTIMGYLQDHQPETTIEELNSIQTETLVIAGEEDLDNGDPAELHEQLPNSRLSIVSGDHMSVFNQLDYAEEIVRFFGEN